MVNTSGRTLVGAALCGVALFAGPAFVGQCRATTTQVVITGLGALKPDWDSGIYFTLESPTLDGDDTVTISNLQLSGANFTFADGAALVNQSPSVGGDMSTDLNTTSGEGVFTPNTFPEAGTVTGINSITLQDSFGNVADESFYFNTFWVTQPTSTLSFDLTTEVTAGSDPSNPDAFFVTLGNCNWPPDKLPTNAPDGTSLLYVPFTSTDPTIQYYSTVPGSGNTSNLPNDTNYPGISAAVDTPEPSPIAALAIGSALLLGMGVRMRRKQTR